MLRKEACSGSIANLSRIRAQWCLTDCLTKKPSTPQALVDAAAFDILHVHVVSGISFFGGLTLK